MKLFFYYLITTLTSHVLILFSFLFFQFPAFFSQMKEAFGFPTNVASGSVPFGGGQFSASTTIPAIPSAVPAVPAVSATAAASGVPAIQVLNDSDSDPDVQSLTIPFRSGSSSSENFLPMISTDDSWISEQDFRFVYICLITSFVAE